MKDLSEIIDDVFTMEFTEWTPSEKEQAISRLENTKTEYLLLLADGDMKKETRRDLAQGHQDVCRMLYIIQDTRKPAPQKETVYLQPQPTDNKVAWAIMATALLLYGALILCH